MTINYEKRADDLIPPASLIKMATALVARQWVEDADLDATVLVVAADMHPPTTAQLQVGDVISWRDLFYGLLVPSGNDASLTIGRLVGEMILAAEGQPAGTGLARFIAEMNSYMAGLGLAGAIAASTHGVDVDSRLSPRHASAMLRELVQDPFLRTVAGTLSRTITITGANARTYTVTHTINPDGAVKFPEFIAGKTGSLPGAGVPGGPYYNVAMLWAKPGGGEAITVCMGCPTTEGRFTDARAIIDYEVDRIFNL